MQLPDWFEEDRWVPPPGSVEKTRTWDLMQRPSIDSFAELRARTLDPEGFHPAVVDQLGPARPVPPRAQWLHPNLGPQTCRPANRALR